MGRILAFDFGGTHVKFGVVDLDGHILHKDKVETPDTLEKLIELVKGQLQSYSNFNITGIAISAPGSVADSGGIYGFSAIPYIHGPNIKNLVEEQTGLPVFIENDANCAALAEVWKGGAKGKKDVAVVVIGTGVGGSLIKDGSVHKGSHLHGGEFGYMILNPNALGSGMNTFSEVASTSSIIKRVASAKGVDSKTLSGEDIFALAENGDDVCAKAIINFYEMLAIGLYNIQYIYDPEIILIGGGISVRKDLLPNIQKKLETLIEKIEVATVMPKVETCSFRADANLIGAVYHFLQQSESIC